MLGFFVVLFSGFFAGASVNTDAPYAYVPVLNEQIEPVPEGSIIRHTFIIYNRGSAALAVSNVRNNWGCSTVSFDRDIPPGGEGKISVTIDTDGSGGQTINKDFIVETNDSAHPKIRLSVSCTIKKVVTITPKIVRLFGPAGRVLRESVKIIPEEAYAFTILEAKAQKGENIHFDLQKVVHKNHLEYLLTVENQKREKGFYSDKIILKTDSSVKPEIRIGVFGKIR